MVNGTNSDDNVVIVLDNNYEFVEAISPALARMALRDDRVTVYEQNPFTIQLARGLLRCPRPTRAKTGSHTNPEVIQVTRRCERKISMSTNFNAHRNPVELTKEIDAYLRSNPDEVWVKATTDMQVVLSPTNKNVQINIKPIPPGDPVNLSYRASIEDLRQSDLRHMIQRGVLKLMSPEEVHSFFEKKAARLEVSVEEARQRALQKDEEFRKSYAVVDRRNGKSGADIMNHERPSDDDAPGDSKINPQLRGLAVKPKIIHLVQSASSKLDPKDRKSAKLLLEEFGDIEDSLSDEDLRHIIEKVEYKTVAAWAKKRLSGEDDTETKMD